MLDCKSRMDPALSAYIIPYKKITLKLLALTPLQKMIGPMKLSKLSKLDYRKDKTKGKSSGKILAVL